MPPVNKEVIDYIQAEVKTLEEELFTLQHSIWAHPELGFEEHFAHDALSSYMEKQPGWVVTKHAYGIDTSFLCVYTHKPESCDTVISINSEYDALPNIGHACGHNLIAVIGVTTAIATAKAMAKYDISGTVKLIGTPAEEGGGGKILLLEKGAYKDADVSLMAHPSSDPTSAFGSTTANQRLILEFYGREAHAAASPWEGINALDAMVMMYNGISVLRQQLKAFDIVQYSIDEGGQAPNIITGYTSATISVRAPTLGRLRYVEAKVLNCIKAAALATGCKYKVTNINSYYNMVCNYKLAELYRHYQIGVFEEEMLSIAEDSKFASAGSTDEGNVSFAVPSLQPVFHVDCANGGPHTKVFASAVSTKKAHSNALKTAMSLSFTALELLKNKEKLEEVKEAWKKDMEIQNSEIFVAGNLTVEKLSELVYTDE